MNTVILEETKELVKLHPFGALIAIKQLLYHHLLIFFHDEIHTNCV